MRKKSFWVGLALSLLLVQTGCDKNETAPENGIYDDEIVLQVGCDTPTETRVNFNYQLPTNTMDVTWGTGDAFMLYCSEGVSAFGLKSGEEGKKVGAFELLNPIQGGIKTFTNCRTFFPRSKGIAFASWEECEFNITGQVQTKNNKTTHLTDYSFMTLKDAPYTIGTGGSPLKFQHEMAILRVEANLSSAQIIRELVLKTTCETVADKNYGFVLVQKASNGQAIQISNRLSLKLEDTTTDQLVAYVVLLPSLLKDGITIDVHTDNGISSISSQPFTSDLLIEAGKMYKLAPTGTLTEITTNTFTSAVTAVPFTGSGTDTAPYSITSAGNLKYLAEEVNTGTSYEGKYFKLTTDISVTASNWEPIGLNADKPFSGHFDGDGHTISGKLNGADRKYFGFFGYALRGSIVNLSVAADVTYTSSFTTDTTYLAAIVGYSQSSLTNCSSTYRVTGTVAASSCVGGLVGYATQARMNDCENYSAVKATSSGGRSTTLYVGGLIGENKDMQVHKSRNNSTSVSASGAEKRSVGGLVGSNQGNVRSCCQCVGALTSWFGQLSQNPDLVPCTTAH